MFLEENTDKMNDDRVIGWVLMLKTMMKGVIVEKFMKKKFFPFSSPDSAFFLG